MSGFDVVVVGGGVIGLNIAWAAASRGLSAVVVDDRANPGATPAAAGMLAPVGEVSYGEEALLALNLAAAERYPQFVTELEDCSGVDIGYRRTGTLVVARDLDDQAQIDELHSYQQSLGLPAQRLRARECRKLQPSLTPTVRGGLLVEGDHSVDNRALAHALAVACAKARVCVKGDRATEISAGAVRTSAGEVVRGDAIVLAVGAQSGTIEGVPSEVAASVRPVKGQLLHLSGPAEPPLLTMTVRGVDIYLVPRSDGRLIVGATVEEAGFDTRVTAGAVYELLRAAYELVPGVTELSLTEAVAGLRPGSVDNAPLIGETTVAALFAATGHYRNGILLAPVTADALVERLVTGTTPSLIEPFSPLRFAV
ncbi:MAG: glycine oxidase ThiO [Actinomycetota bacterium]|nr:glycine oxidase ThiO [Actinomycetota bacterium]